MPEHLHEAITWKRPGQLNTGVHEVFHTPQSPDLSPSDFNLFIPFKNILSGKPFEVLQYFMSPGWEHYQEDMNKLVLCWDKFEWMLMVTILRNKHCNAVFFAFHPNSHDLYLIFRTALIIQTRNIFQNTIYHLESILLFLVYKEEGKELVFRYHFPHMTFIIPHTSPSLLHNCHINIYHHHLSPYSTLFLFLLFLVLNYFGLPSNNCA